MKEAKSYCVTNFGNYAEGLGTLRASGGDIGGGSEVLVIAFDNRPNYFSENTTQSLTADGGGRGTQLIMSYQKVTGCLNQGAHPGSYNGQDAYNDMLVVDEVQNDLMRRGG